MVRTIRRAHAGQWRNRGRIPYWHHCVSVEEILQGALELGREIRTSGAVWQDLRLAALGHDLYEDTAVRPADIRKRFGPRVDAWIRGMTNEGGDRDRAAYVRRMRSAPEEVVLIKLADLTENSLSVAYGINDLGMRWIRRFFLPIVREMVPIVTARRFRHYPRTARVLKDRLAFAGKRLAENIAKFT